jgi:hypothetical protein
MMPAARTTYQEVNKDRLCPVCGGDHKCGLGADGSIQCGRRTGTQPGFVCLGAAKGDLQFSLYRREDDPALRQNQGGGNGSGKKGKGLYPLKATGGPSTLKPADGNGTAAAEAPAAAPRRDWIAAARQLAEALTPEKRAALAALLGLPEHALSLLPLVGFSPKGFHEGYYDQSCFTFPQTDAAGALSGIVCRYTDGTKKLMSGSHAGLYLPAGWRDRPGPVLAVEGPTCTLAGIALGLAVVGRPSNAGGVDLLAQLLRDLPAERPVIVMGEYDPNEKGGWPGLEGARKTAAGLADKLGRNTSWCLPPDKAKDVRAWANAQKLDPACSDSWSGGGSGSWPGSRQNGTSSRPRPHSTPPRLARPNPSSAWRRHGFQRSSRNP